MSTLRVNRNIRILSQNGRVVESKIPFDCTCEDAERKVYKHKVAEVDVATAKKVRLEWWQQDRICGRRQLEVRVATFVRESGDDVQCRV